MTPTPEQVEAFAEWERGVYAGRHLEIAQAAWDAACAWQRERDAQICDSKERRKWEILTSGGALEGFGPLDCAAAIRSDCADGAKG